MSEKVGNRPRILYEIKLLKWEQSKTSIRLTFNIIGIDKIDKNDISLQVSKRNLKLNLKESILAGNSVIPFEVKEFYGLVDAKQTMCQRKGENLTITLKKLEETKWPNLSTENFLTKRGGKSNNSRSESVSATNEKNPLDESKNEEENLANLPSNNIDHMQMPQEVPEVPQEEPNKNSPFDFYRDMYSKKKFSAQVLPENQKHLVLHEAELSDITPEKLLAEEVEHSCPEISPEKGELYPENYFSMKFGEKLEESYVNSVRQSQNFQNN
jgi:hypothetical protein